MRVSAKGISIGEPLREFQGILTGVPQERQVTQDTAIAKSEDAVA
jgi:hypothetical protein